MITVIASKPMARTAGLGDHPVLDFLNTVPMVDGALADSLASDGDVTRWLEEAGFEMWGEPNLRPGELLKAARGLRETIREAVERKKGKKPVVAGQLNAFLAKSSSHLEVEARSGGDVSVVRRWDGRTAEQMLGPLAEAAAELLATDDFELVRRCENEECVLWFYDRTKSHHRRWCSTSTCGNRHKVAAFRERQQAAKTERHRG